VKNTVGAGDSMIAGFIKSFLDTKEWLLRLKWGWLRAVQLRFPMI